MNTITKRDMAIEIWEQFDGKIKKGDILKIIDLFWMEVVAQLKDGNKIELREYGVFKPQWKFMRANAHNPRTGEPAPTTGKRLKVKFTAGRLLRVIQDTEISSDVCAGYKNEPLNDSKSDKIEKVS